MSDRELRDLQRRYACGDLEAGRRLFAERARRGELRPRDLERADLEGERAAARALGVVEALERIEAWIERERPRLHARLRPPAEVEGQLPGTLQELWAWHDGQEGEEGFYDGMRLLSRDEAYELAERLGRHEELEGFLPFLREAEEDPAPPAEDEEGEQGAPTLYERFLCVDRRGRTGPAGSVVLVSSWGYQELDLPDAEKLRYPSAAAWAVTLASSLEDGLWTVTAEGATIEAYAEYEDYVEARYPGFPRPVDVRGDLRCALTCAGLAFLLGSGALGVAVLLAREGTWCALSTAPVLLFALLGVRWSLSDAWRTLRRARQARRLREP